MINSEKLKKIAYGGDYNPEQWPEETWEEDMRLFNLAGIDIVTLNVFSWAALQPDETTYRFEKLDKIMDMVRKNGLSVCLATSTAVHPAWMARKYPDVLRVDAYGRKAKFGGRHNFCPNSPTYRRYSTELAKRIGERYKDYENIVAWHISNEYGGECHCDNCEKAFRKWIKEKYKTIEEVNRVWNTSFWGHTFYDWEEIVLPNYLSEHFGDERSVFQGISLDYRRFNSDSLLDCYRGEYDVLKEITPDIPITTNLMGFYKPLDYQKWAKYMDFISWDNYPANDEPPAGVALSHALHRGLKDGMPFALMEQTPSVTNWHQYNALKRPGVMRLLSYQAVAHGSDTIMFFQMRRSIGACEKYHGAVIDHAGHENTRIFRELAALGKELEQIENKTLGSLIEADVAILVDWDNWWALEYSAGPSCDLKYLDEVKKYYQALHDENIAVDIIGTDSDLSSYKIVIAPVLYMVKGDYHQKIEAFTANGGTFVTTFFSGIVNENDLVTLGGYPGKLRKVLGIWTEEIDALPGSRHNTFMYKNEQYTASLLCDIMHLETAHSLGNYEEDFYAGMPAVTENQFGQGTAYSVGTRSTDDFYRRFLMDLCQSQNIKPVCEAPDGVEATRRTKDGKNFLFILNHNETPVQIAGPVNGINILNKQTITSGETITLAAKDVMIIEESCNNK